VNRFILSAAVLLAVSVNCPAHEFTSGPDRTDLIELFTSEGCSSCPPADRKLGALAGNKGLWKEFVPVAFHVDYWNYLGWIDPYSSPAYSARQRRYTDEWNAGSSYTPCFVVNGVATRNPGSTGGSDRSGILKAVLKDDQATITFTPENGRGSYIAWIAPLSGRLSSSVTAGENRFRELNHIFVALGLVSSKMESNDRIYSATMTLPSDDRTEAIAVWVSNGISLTPLQATGGWLTPKQ